MPLTADDLEAAFATSNQEDLASFEFDDGIGKYTGHVVHRDFRGVSIPDRQRIAWEVLRRRFGEDSQQVSLVLTYSPAEWEEIGEPDQAA